MNFEKQAVYADRNGRPGESRNKLALPPGRTSCTARQLDRMRRIEDDRHPDLAQHDERTHVRNQVLVAKAGPAFGDQHLGASHRARLFHHVLHLPGREELALLEVRGLAGCRDGDDEVGLAAEKSRGLQDIDHLGARRDIFDAVNIRKEGQARLGANVLENAQALVASGPTERAHRGAIRLVERGLENEAQAQPFREFPQGTRMAQGRVPALDHARPGDDGQPRPPAKANPADADFLYGHPRSVAVLRREFYGMRPEPMPKPPTSSLAHKPTLQRLGKRAGRLGRVVLDRVLDLVFPAPAPIGLPAEEEIREILLVRPNFRIGNALLATPLVGALQARFPRARVSVLATDATRIIFERTPVERIHTTTRRSVSRPWLVWRLFRELRQCHYDLAVEGGMGSFSGGLWTWLCGARFRVGVTGRNRRFLNVPLPELHPDHAYDWTVEVAAALDAEATDHPEIDLRDEDHEAARLLWEEAGLLRADGSLRPHVATFVGGHLDKRWGNDNWVELIRALGEHERPVLVLVGPEERELAHEIAQSAGPNAFVVAPGPLPRLAAILGAAELVISTDSGPMHLAVAAGARLLTLVTAETSKRYTPRGPQDRTLIRPTPAEVLAAADFNA